MVRGSETYGELERYDDDENENSDVDNDASNERSTTVTEVYDIDNIHELVEREGERIRFPTTNSDEDSTPSSLDPYPEAYRLTNFALRERFFRYQHDVWPNDQISRYAKHVMDKIEYSTNDNDRIEEQDLSTFYDESKIEDYDERSWKIVRNNYYEGKMRTGNDYRIDLMFPERIAMRQREITDKNFSLIAAMESNQEYAFVKTSDKLTTEVWVGDTGASCHMRSSLAGMFDLEPGTGGIKVGSGKVLKIIKVGKFRGEVKQKDGSTKILILDNVHFVPDLYCNLFSITSAMDDGYGLSGRKDEFLTLRKNDMVIKFDQVIKSGTGKLVGVKIIPTNKTPKLVMTSTKKAHDVLAHAGEKRTRATAKKLGWTLTNELGPCPHCATAKAKVKSVDKITESPASHKGHIFAIDISSASHESIGGRRYWLRVHDIFTDMKWSYFLNKKSETSGKVRGLIKHLKIAEDVTVKTIRCDNAGENKSLQNDCIKEGLGINFQFTAPYTPQHNGSIERSFATSYGRMRAMLNASGIKGNLRQTLWAEAANFENDTDNIMVDRNDEACAYEKFYGRMPGYSNFLQGFGQIGIAKNGTKISGKLKDKGTICMMIGYATENTPGTYRLLNLSTKRVFKSINVKWLNINYKEFMSENSIELSNRRRNNDKSRNFVDIELNDDDTLNQGAMDSVTEFSETEDIAEQEGRERDNETTTPTTTTNRVTRSQVTFANPIDRPAQPQQPKRLRNEVRSLYSNFAQEVENACLIAESLLIKFDEAAETILALVGGTDTSADVPTTFDEAWNHPDPTERKLWREAIRKEFRDMIRRGVWRHHSKSKVAADRRIIGCKWIFRIKNDGRHRARLCAIGYTQVAGVDYQDNFAPVVNDVAFRIAIIMMLVNGWDADIVDIETAFLYGDLEEEIYMKVPEGYADHLKTEFDDDTCLLLVQTMYGLVQAARQYYKKIIEVMVTKLGFEKCMADPCLLRRENEAGTLIVCVYVDDILCIGDRSAIDSIKIELAKYFSVKDEGRMEEYVGCSVIRNNIGNVILHQPYLLKSIEREFGEELKSVRAAATPAATGDAVERMTDEEKKKGGLPKERQTRYRSAVGMMLYLVKFSRPDIANSVRELTKAMDCANETHYKAMTRVLKYVMTTRDLGLKYDSGTIVNFKGVWKIVAYCDSDFAGDKNIRTSVTGFCIYIGDNLISWKARAQKSVTLSSTEAEYVAVSEVCAEIIFIKYLLEFVGVNVKYPITVMCDNVGAIFLSNNAKNSNRTKHVDIRAHFVRQYVEDGIIKVNFVRSADNEADTFTKNVSGKIFRKHATKNLISTNGK